MNRDEIIDAAKEAGIDWHSMWTLDDDVNRLERFAALVAAHEREQCAKVCDAKATRAFSWGSENADRYHAQADWAAQCAKAIRARGES